MKLAYTGPKPIISHTGIIFDKNKDDKYSYLNALVKLLHVLDHEYVENKTYAMDTDSHDRSADDLYKELKKYCPQLDEIIKTQSHDVTAAIELSISRIDENRLLNSFEKEALENNIKLMSDYRVQRTINKSVYYCGVRALAKIVEKERIKYISVPMVTSYTHILHSLQGVLRARRRPIDSSISIYRENEKLVAKLQIGFN